MERYLNFLSKPEQPGLSSSIRLEVNTLLIIISGSILLLYEAMLS